jgi:hypothetical protein
MPNMNKPQLAKLAKLESRLQDATQAIYAVGGFSQAGDEIKAAYHSAADDLDNFRQGMIDHGRGHRSHVFGHFTPNCR